MQTFHASLIVFLLLNMVVAMLRVIRGPTTADRLLTGQLFGTTGVAILLLLAETSGQAALRDVALVFALLAVLLVAGFVRTAGRQPAPAKAQAASDQ